MKIYNKLVRDNIPNIIKESGLSYDIKILNDDEYSFELKRKLVEEANELLNTNNDNELLEELADVYEVLDYILSQNNISIESVTTKRSEKNNIKGKFNSKLFLKYVE